MKIIDAVWEERNLGVTCYELQLDRTDQTEDVAAILDSMTERQYMVAKIPSARYDLICLFQERGYSFIEAMLTFETDLRDYQISQIDVPRRLRRICEKCSCEVMNEEDLRNLSEVIRGNLFITDRVSLDPAFTPEQAARRYDLWSKDLVRQGAVPYKVVVDHEVAGFFIRKELAPHKYEGVLAGTCYDSGLGYCVEYAGLASALEIGAKKMVGHCSGNNIEILRLVSSFGRRRITAVAYNMVKHNF